MQEALECTEQSSCRQSWRASESRVVVLQQANQNKALHTESQSLNRVLLRANTNHESKLRFASELLLYLTTLTEFIFGSCQPVFIFSCLVTVSRSVCFYTPLFRVQSQPATNEMASVVRASLRSSVVHTDRSTAWTQRLRLPLPAPASITADSPSLGLPLTLTGTLIQRRQITALSPRQSQSHQQLPFQLKHSWLA